MSLIKPQVQVKHVNITARIEEPLLEPFKKYCEFLGNSTQSHVINELVKLAVRDKEFLAWQQAKDEAKPHAKLQVAKTA